MAFLPFHHLINAWFSETYGKPTSVQEEAWPLIAEGKHVLALAPTGSGKTLTGFLAAISRFAEGKYETGCLSVLYVSPLKALNEDIKRNLTIPLEGIRAVFERAGEAFPAIRVETRSGDTPQSERRRFLSMPPSILALTPESLGIILLNPRGRQVLSTVRYVIIDEIHTALGSKRGSFLSCQIDRLALAAGEFQRVALSATVRPPEAAADFAGGLKKTETGYEKRKVHIVAPESKKELRFQVIFPDTDNKEEDAGGNSNIQNTEYSGVDRYGKRYAELVKFVHGRIKAKEGAILVFTDSRRRAERLSYLINRAAEAEPGYTGRPASYCHHGSLSKEVRREVEKALASGEISCVVATGSLELGIDIGSINEVILAGSPGSAAIALQRVGRSGHAVGETSKGWLIPFHGMDLLQAAAISGAVEEKELETTKCIENPLDILAQEILALCVERDWNEEELFNTLRGFYVYRKLPRSSYDRVVRMLAGAYEASRLRELKRRLFRDDPDGSSAAVTLHAPPGTQLLLYTSGGVITNRGSYSLRLAAEGTKIGELDEEFVWEQRLGDCFDFGNRSWKISKISDEAVEVIPLPSGADSVPFWKGETIYRSPNLSRRMLEVLDGYYPKAWTSLKAEKMLDSFSAEARKTLEDFLYSQWSFQNGMPMPGPSFIPIEIIDDPVGRGDSYSVFMYSFRGGSINFPLSLALAQDIEAAYKVRVQGTADDNAVFIRLPRSIAGDPSSIIFDSLRRLGEGEKGEERFRERFESSGVFNAAFREAAERSLVLPRSPFGKRMPLWVTRQKSKRLFDSVSAYSDFPVTAEAWRACLMDQFDMEGFSSLLEQIGNRSIVLDFFKTKRPSPFAKELSWAETNTLMYEYDQRDDLLGPLSKEKAGPSLSDQVIAEALGNADSRPALKAELTGDFCSRLRREIPGWAPEDILTLSEWVKERIAIPDDEWKKLLECVPQELAQELQEDKSLGGKIEYIQREGARVVAVVHREWTKKWKGLKGPALASECLLPWLRFQGPIPLSRIADVFGLTPEEAEAAVNALSEQGDLATNVALEPPHSQPSRSAPSLSQPFLSEAPLSCTGADLVCDRENLELLLRMSRRRRRPEVRERPASLLIPFIARRQGLLRGRTGPGHNKAEESAPWEKLSGIAAPAKLWETEFFPCRFASPGDYSGEMLDRELREGKLVWYGAGKEKTAFCRPDELDLLLPVSPAPELAGEGFFDTPRHFWEIKEALAAIAGGTDTGIAKTAQGIWKEAWRGSLSSDSWEPLRKALEDGFVFPESDYSAYRGDVRGHSRIPRALRERWKTGPPVTGNWFSLASDPVEISPLEEEELNRERVRLLLSRWGILARPLLEREGQYLSWSLLLPAMRRMELSGELVAGRFFSGINSLQFASPEIPEELEEAEAEQGIYWMNAADPASPAGITADGIMSREMQSSGKNPVIRHISSTRLCYRGAELLAISSKGGKELEIFISEDYPDIAIVLDFIKLPKTRKVQRESRVVIEKINGKTAAGSAYSAILSAMGFVKDRGRMVLW